MAKAPQRNPFGEEEEPIPFQEMDIFTRVRILQQLSTWTFVNSDRIRSLMPQEEDHMNWRMEPLGWDKEDRAYFVLDDNRLYRRGDEAPPPPSPKRKAKPKAKPKPSKQSRDRGTRASKRRKIEDSSDDELEETKTNAEPIDEVVMTNGDQPILEEDAGFGFTSKTWECVAVTLEEYQEFLSSIFRSRDPNEKHLRIRIEEDVLPIIEKRAEALRQKQMKRMRELENLQKMATAKRSNRLADKAEREKQEREEREAEEKHKLELEMARKEQDKQKRIEEVSVPGMNPECQSDLYKGPRISTSYPRAKIARPRSEANPTRGTACQVGRRGTICSVSGAYCRPCQRRQAYLRSAAPDTEGAAPKGTRKARRRGRKVDIRLRYVWSARRKLR